MGNRVFRGEIIVMKTLLRIFECLLYVRHKFSVSRLVRIIDLSCPYIVRLALYWMFSMYYNRQSLAFALVSDHAIPRDLFVTESSWSATA